MKSKLIVDSAQSESGAPDYILFKFDSLLPGNGFIIDEDNDPHSLYFQMLKEKGDTFSWEYLTGGPKKWSIKISKREPGACRETLGEMAVADHRKALILRKYGLDFSFRGKRTLKEACADKDISTKNIERELAASGHQSLIYTVNYNSWELDYLADFIITNHHQYTKKILHEIADEFEKRSRIIYQNYAHLLPLIEVFKQLHETMNAIMQLEEQVLFPYIRFLVQVTRGKIVGNALPQGSVQDHINKIESLHLKIAEQIQYIRHFTGNFTMPHIKNTFYPQILQWLNEFDNDLHQHVHVENNILFRKALKLEQEYLANEKIPNNTGGKNNSVTDYLSSLL